MIIIRNPWHAHGIIEKGSKLDRCSVCSVKMPSGSKALGPRNQLLTEMDGFESNKGPLGGAEIDRGSLRTCTNDSGVISHQFPMVFQCFSMVFLVSFIGFSMVFLWFSHAFLRFPQAPSHVFMAFIDFPRLPSEAWWSSRATEPGRHPWTKRSCAPGASTGRSRWTPPTCRAARRSSRCTRSAYQ